MTEVNQKGESEYFCAICGKRITAGSVSDLCDACEVAPEEASTVTSRDGPPPAVTEWGNAGPQPFGDYELVDKLAQGGMGVVYRARQRSLNRDVAIKMILGGAFANQGEIDRFQTEALAVADLEHPNIVPIYEVGEHDGQRFLCMRLVEGGNLFDKIAALKSDLRRVAEIMSKVSRAVDYAHRRGILHRDLKPANILLSRSGEPMVTDFGLAKRLDSDVQLTATGAILGTPGYMAPEQANGETGRLSTAVDVYGLGSVLFHLMTGRPPFVADTPVATLKQVIEQEPVSPAALNPGVTRDLETICLKCLEKVPERRYGSAHELADDLDRWLRYEAILARPCSTANRVIKWARRKPALATLTLFASFSLIAFIGLTLHNNKKLATEKGIAETQKDIADEERRRSEDMLTDLRLKQAEDHFAADETDKALMYLAAILRTHSTNEQAARRLQFALAYRDYATPGTSRLQHDAPVNHGEFSPDGAWIATASNDRSVVVWDAKTGNPTARLQLKHLARSVKFSPDGSKVVTASSDRVAVIWDYKKGTNGIVLLPHQSYLKHAEFDPEGRRVATASDDKSARVWDVETGKQISKSFEHDDRVNHVSFSPDGKFMVTACRGQAGGAAGYAQIWDLSTGDPHGPRLEHDGGVTKAIFSRDGLLVATASGDLRMQVWIAATGRPAYAAYKHERPVVDVEFSPDSSKLVTASQDATAVIWDVKAGRVIGTVRHNGSVNSVRFSFDGARILTTLSDNSAQVWDAESGKALAEPVKHQKAVVHGTFSPDGSRFLTVSSDKSARVWRMPTNSSPAVRIQHRQTVLAAKLNFDESLLATASWDAAIRIWDPETGAASGAPLPNGTNATAIVFHPHNNQLVTGGIDGSLRLWDLSDRDRPRYLIHHRKRITVLEFSPDSSRLLSASRDGTLALWRLPDRKPERTFRHTGNWVEFATFSADGKRILSCANDLPAKIWDAETGAALISLPNAGAVVHADFSPTGDKVVTANTEGDAFVWSIVADPPTIIHELPHASCVNIARFSPGGDIIVTASNDRTAVLWNTMTGDPIAEPLMHEGAVRHAEFSLDGRAVITGSDDGVVRVWDALKGQALTGPMRHGDRVFQAVFNRAGDGIVTASHDKTAVIWPLPEPFAPHNAEQLVRIAESIAGGRLNAQGVPVPVADY